MDRQKLASKLREGVEELREAGGLAEVVVFNPYDAVSLPHGYELPVICGVAVEWHYDVPQGSCYIISREAWEVMDED